MFLKVLLIKSLAILTFIFSAATIADIEPYVGAQYSYLEYDNLLDSEHATFDSGFARLGFQFSDALSTEVRVGVGANNSRVATNADLQLKSAVGIYVRAGVEATNWLYPYIIAGWTRTNFERSFFGVGSTTESDADISSGLGVDFKIAGGFRLNLEYMYYFDNSETEIEAASFGFIQTF